MTQFKTIMTDINVTAMLHDIGNHPELWNRQGSIVLRYNDPDDNLNQFELNWLECINYPAMILMPAVQMAIMALVFALRCDRIGRAQISEIPEHGYKVVRSADTPFVNTLLTNYYDRYIIWLTEGVTTLTIGDETITPKMGDVIQWNSKEILSIENKGDDADFALVVDLKKPVMRAFYGADESAVAPVIKDPERPAFLDA